MGFLYNTLVWSKFIYFNIEQNMGFNIWKFKFRLKNKTPLLFSSITPKELRFFLPYTMPCGKTIHNYLKCIESWELMLIVAQLSKTVFHILTNITSFEAIWQKKIHRLNEVEQNLQLIAFFLLLVIRTCICLSESEQSLLSTRIEMLNKISYHVLFILFWFLD